MLRAPFRLIVSLMVAFIFCSLPVQGQEPASAADNNEKLHFVVYLSRHDVRSPTGKLEQYNVYSAAPWPAWDVAPGYLTTRGFQLMMLFGAYDRAELTGLGLLTGNACADASQITIYADSDQRTRETGKALAEGLAPGCTIPVQALPEGTRDPLFHSVSDGSDRVDSSFAVAAIAGRIGGDATNLTAAYRSQLRALNDMLASCGANPSEPRHRTSLFDIPATLSRRQRSHPEELRVSLNTAATLAENLLEYIQGMDTSSVGWGCVDGTKLRSLLALHSAAEELTACFDSVLLTDS